METNEMEQKLLRFRELRNAIPLSRSTIWRKVNDGTFPAPIQISKVAIAWLKSDIERWISEQVEVSQRQK